MRYRCIDGEEGKDEAGVEKRKAKGGVIYSQ
jgi:hypothetical protein